MGLSRLTGLRLRGDAELAERAMLDLAHTLAREADPLTYLAQRLLVAVEPVASTEDHPLTFVEA